MRCTGLNLRTRNPWGNPVYTYFMTRGQDEVEINVRVTTTSGMTNDCSRRFLDLPVKIAHTQSDERRCVWMYDTGKSGCEREKKNYYREID